MKASQGFRYELQVEKVEDSCLFELQWGGGQQLKATIDFPNSLFEYYQAWQRAYVYFYRTGFRGRVESIGSLSPLDPRQQLVAAEARLLKAFRGWLWHEELANFYRAIAETAKSLSPFKTTGNYDQTRIIRIYLTCTPLAIARLPWESWEIESQLGTSASICLIRCPANRPHLSVQNKFVHKKGKKRVLAIFGDQTGLNCHRDRLCLRTLEHLAEIEMVIAEPDEPLSQLKDRLKQAIVDQRGWDMLYFAGHSQETETTGGTLSIGSHTTIAIREISPQLIQALNNGLTFALFNSCSGMGIANDLMELGLAQVAIMREPVHDPVASIFLEQFVKQLANYHDVAIALKAAGQYLKVEAGIEFPSTGLVASLFANPEVDLFQLRPFGLREQLKNWLPSRYEIIGIVGFVTLSLFFPLQDYLLNGRTFTQALYRDLTGQIPSTLPRVTLVEIDQDSLQQAGITTIKPLDRRYLATIIDRLTAHGAQIVGIDYLLDQPQRTNDPMLAKSLQKGIEKQQTWFIFASIYDGNEIKGVIPDVAKLSWSLEANISGLPQYLTLPTANCQPCSLAYLLAVVQTARELQTSFKPSLSRENSNSLQEHLLGFLDQTKLSNNKIKRLLSLEQTTFTQIAKAFYQTWGRPIRDFSLPPDTIYQSITSAELLGANPQNQAKIPYPLSQQVILIASAGYAEAGIHQNQDYFPQPTAISFWQERRNSKRAAVMTGGQAQAYAIHHWLTHHLVLPVPNPLIIFFAVILGKGLTQFRISAQFKKQWIIGLGLSNLAYGLLGLQLYISLNILLPIVFPSFLVWYYLLPYLNKSSYETW